MHCCGLNNSMSSIKSTPRLVAVCQKDQVASFDNRQIPINIDENLFVNFFLFSIDNKRRKQFFFF
jgi:hypothetical protein